jgi:hypothetical protein
MRHGRGAQSLAPQQYHDVDIGEPTPVQCLYNGLWLCRSGDLNYAVLLCHHREYEHEAAVRIEIAAPAGNAAEALIQRCFLQLEEAVHAARSYPIAAKFSPSMATPTIAGGPAGSAFTGFRQSRGTR